VFEGILKQALRVNPPHRSEDNVDGKKDSMTKIKNLFSSQSKVTTTPKAAKIPTTKPKPAFNIK